MKKKIQKKISKTFLKIFRNFWSKSSQSPFLLFLAFSKIENKPRNITSLPFFFLVSIFSKICSKKLWRLAQHLNDTYERTVWRTTTTTEQRQGTQIQHITSRLNAVSDQVSLQASAKEKTTEASEASNRRIHDLEETVKKGKGSALELDVHVKETASRFRGLTDQCNQQRQQIESLQALVSTLTTRLEAQEAIPTRRCTSCDKEIPYIVQTCHTSG